MLRQRSSVFGVTGLLTALIACGGGSGAGAAGGGGALDRCNDDAATRW
ncbi:hypothetical protein [Sorangium sp. So ce1151]